MKLDVAFLKLKQDVIGFKYYQIAFFTHVYTSIFILFLGFPQFSRSFLKKYSWLHRLVGKAYVFLILFLASPSGLVMAYHANGGFWSRVSFVIQAIIWFVFTFKAYTYARDRNIVLHRKYMFRSYALTLSAISLRLIKLVIVSLLELPPMDTYKIVSWLGWVVNLILVEVYLRYKHSYDKKT